MKITKQQLMDRSKRIPDLIYLQIYGADQRDMEDTQAAHEVTWERDAIYDTDELYCRHTHFDRVLREKDKFEAERDIMRRKVVCYIGKSRVYLWRWRFAQRLAKRMFRKRNTLLVQKAAQAKTIEALVSRVGQLEDALKHWRFHYDNAPDNLKALANAALKEAK